MTAKHVDELFFHALTMTSPTEREAYLRDKCGDDESLLERVNRLIDASRQASQFLEEPAVNVQRTLADAGHAEGKRIGPYKVLEKIGEGGMGVVYMAGQKEPVKRAVALKIIKPGMDTQQVVRRFKAERQALAMMDHPNIASVYDAGTTEGGLPYFVMELVKGGIPITQYCDEHRLSTAERLKLFVQACSAIQHAHQKGVIHRDIKPSNILVTEYDDVPSVKVIDFGVAKAVNNNLVDSTMFTSLGQLMGTFEYMSPEQAKLNQWDVDTRSDIYSLGVLLYELLTGNTPFDAQQLRKAALDEALRIIREEPAPTPSTRLTDPKTVKDLAHRRRVEPSKLGSLVQGELDWIVMKAIEKERKERYATVGEFAEDIENHLNNEPVNAHPPSPAYRLRKFAHRYRAGIGIVVGLVVLLAIGTTTSTVLAVRARRAEQLAAQQQREAERERDRARQAERRTREEKERADNEAEAATFTLNAISSVLVQGDREENPERNTPLAVIKRLSAYLDETPDATPEVEAYIRLFLGRTLHSRGNNALARQHLMRAKTLIGPDGDPALRERILTQLVYVTAGKTAIAYLDELRSLRTTPREVAAFEGLMASRLVQIKEYDEAHTLATRALNTTLSLDGSDSSSTGWRRLDLAECLEPLGRYEEAEAELRKACQIFAVSGAHVSHVRALARLGLFLKRRERHPEAVVALTESVNLGGARDDSRKWTVPAAYAIARLHLDCRNYEVAKQFSEQAADVALATYGRRNSKYQQAAFVFALSCEKSGDKKRSQMLFQRQATDWQQMLANGEKVWGRMFDPICLVETYSHLPASLSSIDESIRTLDECAAMRNVPESVWSASVRGEIYLRHGKVEDARTALRYASNRKAGFQQLNRYVVEVLVKLERSQNDLEAAERALRHALDRPTEETGLTEIDLLLLTGDLVELLVEQERFEDAAGDLDSLVAAVEHPLVGIAEKQRLCRLLATVHTQLDDQTEATMWLQRIDELKSEPR